MQFRQTTVLGLFDSSQKHFVIPVYQRAYSWVIDEWTVFLNDLTEQIKGNNNYFFGNILLETVRKDIEYEIIDGQQRLTTLTIFFRSLIDVFSERQIKEKIEIDLGEKAKIYLKNGGNIKIRPVDYDKACFNSLIVDGNKKYVTITPSQDRIYEAKKYFIKELEKLTTTDLILILDKIESTELTCIELPGKKDSALMFELQNNRGKELTNMEKLKSYFMYQMYVYSPVEEIEQNIEGIANIFKLIYLTINDLNSLSEDSVLIYHCNAYIKGYNYRNLDDLKGVYIESSNKIEWIKAFVNELSTTFTNIKKMEKSMLHNLLNLRRLSIPAFAYPFIIKGYKFLGENNAELNTLYQILEIVVFRYRLINSRAEFNSRINEILVSFSGNLFDLKSKFERKLKDADYWSDYRVQEALDGNMYRNRVIHYLLWEYENSIQNKGYKIGNHGIEDEQIEHISPQNPSNGDHIKSGYQVNTKREYDESFLEEYLNSVGNLMLISGTHNKSIGNKPFNKKLESYNSNPLLRQQAEIKNYISLTATNKERWDKVSIDLRHKAIVEDFAIKRWNFNNIKITEGAD